MELSAIWSAERMLGKGRSAVPPGELEDSARRALGWKRVSPCRHIKLDAPERQRGSL